MIWDVESILLADEAINLRAEHGLRLGCGIDQGRLQSLRSSTREMLKRPFLALREGN